MSDFTGETKDGTQGNIEELMRLFPQVVTETKDGNGRLVRSVDFAALRELLGDDASENDERYDFTWAGKKEAMREAARPTRKTLRPCKEESKNWDTTRNLYIEGDNLEALKILENTYHGQVKMIYIDPPYNTGGDFLYHDDCSHSLESEELLSGAWDAETKEQYAINPPTNGKFHSDWCSMIYPRLVYARKLLRDDGVIFISIDDNEVSNLRKIADQVFGESNFICSFAWQKRYSPPPDTKDVGYTHETIILYRRSDRFVMGLLPFTEEQVSRYQNPDNDPRGPWKAADYTCRYTAAERPSLYYPIVNPNTGKEVYPKKTRVWANSRESHAKNELENRLWWGVDGMNEVPALKNYLSEIKQGSMPTTLLFHKEVGHTDEATKELRSLLPDVKFTPKPTRLIQTFIRIANLRDNDYVVDFFSGSATTADAVMKYTVSEGMALRHVMVQLPEVCVEDSEAAKAGYKNICEIGKERIRRAGEKISEELRVKKEEREKNKDLFDSSKSGEDAASPLDIGFRVFKVSDSNMEDVFYSPNEVTQAMLPGMVNNVKEGRTGLDLLISTRLEWGLSIDCPIDEETVDGKTVFSVDGGQMLACFETGITDAFVKKLAMRKPQFAIFRDVDFKDSAAKINAREIFKAVCGKDAPTEVRFL